MSDRVAVTYLDLVVVGPAARICQQPAHPHTVALLPAVLVADPQA